MSDIYCAACREPLPVECDTIAGELVTYVRPCKTCVRRIIRHFATHGAVFKQEERNEEVVCKPRASTFVRPSAKRNAQGKPTCIVQGCGVVIERKKGRQGVPLYCSRHKFKKNRP